jgi:hypothetical protein
VFRKKHTKITAKFYGTDSLCVFTENVSVLIEFLYTKGTGSLKYLWAHAGGMEESSESISHTLSAYKYTEHC